MTEKRRMIKSTDGDKEETKDILSKCSVHQVLQSLENVLGSKKVKDLRVMAMKAK